MLQDEKIETIYAGNLTMGRRRMEGQRVEVAKQVHQRSSSSLKLQNVKSLNFDDYRMSDKNFIHSFCLFRKSILSIHTLLSV